MLRKMTLKMPGSIHTFSESDHSLTANHHPVNNIYREKQVDLANTSCKTLSMCHVNHFLINKPYKNFHKSGIGKLVGIPPHNALLRRKFTVNLQRSTHRIQLFAVMVWLYLWKSHTLTEMGSKMVTENMYSPGDNVFRPHFRPFSYPF